MNLFANVPAPQQKNMRMFFLGQLVYRTGNIVQFGAAGLQVLELSGSPSVMGLSVGLALLPFAIVLIFGGMIADRYQKRTILLIAYSIGLALTLILIAVCIVGAVAPLVLITLMMTQAFVSSFERPAQRALLSELAGKDVQLAVIINSRLILLSTLLGGAVLVSIFSLTTNYLWAYVFNGATFLVIIGSTYALKHASPSFSRSVPHRWLEEWKQLRQLVRVKELVPLAFIMLTVAMVGNSMKDLWALAGREMGASVVMVGGMVIVFTLGGLQATHSLGKRSVRKARRAFFLMAGDLLYLCVSQVVVSIGVFDIHVRSANVGNGALLILGVFCMGWKCLLVTTTAESLIMRRVPAPIAGKAQGLFISAFNLTLAFGSLIIGLSTEYFTFSTTVIASSAVALVLYLYVLFLAMQGSSAQRVRVAKDPYVQQLLESIFTVALLIVMLGAMILVFRID